jgi:hypothetical protein
MLKVKPVIEVSGASRGLRFNGLPEMIYDSRLRDPQSYRCPADDVGGYCKILPKVRRNYIYFSSLLQEPEAKWRQSMCFSSFSFS